MFEISKHVDISACMVNVNICNRTRGFSNHKSHLLSWSHTFAIIIILVQLAWYYIKVCGYSNYLQKLYEKVNDPKMTFGPTSVEVTCVTLPKDHCIQVPWKYVKVCGYSDLFFSKTWTKGHWPLGDLWPQVCCGHMCNSTQGSFCPIPMKIHQSMWIQWPLSKTWTKGHWPLYDLWPQVCWGHMCDSTQGPLCPSPMGIHHCTWIQWSILQNFNQDYHILHTAYILRTTYRMSDHIVSSWTKFRRDKKGKGEKI